MTQRLILTVPFPLLLLPFFSVVDDWFDGLQTFVRYICCRDWLGGWLLPQERSFFALQFPRGWWLFCLDNALSDDIDALQFKYFASIIERMGEDDRVIIATHEPDWIIDTHDKRTSGSNTAYLIKILKGKVALRLAGDLHCYYRHMPSPLIQEIKTTIKSQVSTAFNASAASSLVRGLMGYLFARKDGNAGGSDGGVEDDGEAHTIANVNELLAKDQAKLTEAMSVSPSAATAVPVTTTTTMSSDTANGTIIEEQQVSYSSMIYSKFTSYGGDGEGVFLEDIMDTLNPSIPISRTQSMPAIQHHIQASPSAALFKLNRSKAKINSSSMVRLTEEEEGELLQEDEDAVNNDLTSSRSSKAPKSARKKRHLKNVNSTAASSSSSSGLKDLPTPPPSFTFAPAHESEVGMLEPSLEACLDTNATTSSVNTTFSTIGGGDGDSVHALGARVRAWSNEEVCTWLTSVHITEDAIHDAFKANDVDGRLLLELDHTDLIEMGVQSQLKRKKIMIEINEMRQKLRDEEEEDDDDDEEHDEDDASGLSCDDVDSDGSESEQLARNILSASVSTLDLHDSSSAALATDVSTLDPCHASVSSTVTLPDAPSTVPKSISMPVQPSQTMIGLTAEPIDPTYVFNHRNVDLVSLSPTAPLTLESVISHTQQAELGRTIEHQIERALAAEPSPIPSANVPLSARASAPPTLASTSHTKQHSMSAATALVELPRDSPTLRALNPRSSMFDNLPPMALSSSSGAGAPMSSTPRANESLFGAGAVGVGPHSSATRRRSSRSPSTVSTSFTCSSPPMYNHPDAPPIPTDLKESVNQPFPEGSPAPAIYTHPSWSSLDDHDGDASSQSTIDTTNPTYLGVVAPSENVRPPPVLIVSGGGGAFLHPTSVPDPGPILFRGNRYVRASSYPPVSVSRAYALLNLFGFRRRNWRFDMFGGVLYFLMAFSLLPICNLDHIIESTSWYDALWQYILAIFNHWCLVISKGHVSLFMFTAIWLMLLSFGEVAWPWYKRAIIGTLHTLAHQLSAMGALVLMETCVEMGIHRKLIGQGEVLYQTFTRTFPIAATWVDQLDTQCYGIFGIVARLISNIVDVPDNMAHYKQTMCDSPDTMTRGQMWLYYFNCGLYLWVLMTPLVSFVFGAYLYVASTFLNAHYTEAFSSLRLEVYKNFLRFHINRDGDLEVYTLGIDHVPKQWTKSSTWSGHTQDGTVPSYEWSEPSVLKPEKGEPDRIKLIDYLVINKNPRSKEQFIRNDSNMLHHRQPSNMKYHPPPATSTRGPSIASLLVPASPTAQAKKVTATMKPI